MCGVMIAMGNSSVRIKMLDQRNVHEYLEPKELPRLWPEMYVPWQADAVRPPRPA